MTQYSDKVEEVRLKQDAEEWGKSIRYLHFNNGIEEILEKKKLENASSKITKKANLEIFISSIFFPAQINIKLLNRVAEA